MSNGSRRRGLALRSLLFASVLVGSFVLFDAIYLRARFGPVRLYLENHPVYHHRLIPNATTISASPGDYHTLVRANSLGLRGREIESPKPADVYRIVMLGDSFTMGKGVEENETFSSRVEQRLAEHAGSLPPLRHEVVNAGVDSFSPLLEYLLLREEWDRLAPDLVVVDFDMSDLMQDSYYQTLVHRGPEGQLRGAKSDERQSLDFSGTGGLGRWLNNNTYFSAALYRWLFPPGKWAVAHMATPTLLLHTLAGSENDYQAEWRRTLRNLHRIVMLCRARDVPVVLAVYPWAHQLGPEVASVAMGEFLEPGYVLGDRTGRMLADFAARYELPFVDATPAFRKQPHPASLYFERDLHWNAAGHALMAEQLGPVVEATIRASQAEASAAR